jgi:hypothetical protein
LKLFPKDSEVIALMDMNPPPDNVNQNPPVRKPRPKARKLTYTKKRTQTQAKKKKPPPKKITSAIKKITQTKRSKSRQQNYEYTSESDSEESDSDDSETDESETDESETDSSDEQPSRKRIAKYHSTSDFTSESESDSSESNISMDTSQQDTNDTLQNEYALSSEYLNNILSYFNSLNVINCINYIGSMILILHYVQRMSHQIMILIYPLVPHHLLLLRKLVILMLVFAIKET